MRDQALREANVLRRAQLPDYLFARDNASLETPQYFRLRTAIEAEAAD